MKFLLAALVPIAVLVNGCGQSESALVARSDALSSMTTLIGRGTFDPFHVKRKSTDQPKWEIDLNAKAETDIVVQKVTFPSGASSGWHTHPGPVLITVTKGTLTFYEASDPTCSPNVLSAGRTLVDESEENHGHLARNEGKDPAETAVTIFLPKGAPTRNDLVPEPPNCPPPL